MIWNFEVDVTHGMDCPYVGFSEVYHSKVKTIYKTKSKLTNS